MARDSREENKSSILYELLVLAEWVEDHDSVVSKNALSNSIQESTYFSRWKLFGKSKLFHISFLQTEYLWHLAVSKDGKVVAVLQETLLEIRTAKDEFSSVVGKACIPNDQFPKLRKLSWSPDNSLLAVARDNGIVYVFNLFGCNIATIEPAEINNTIPQPVVGLCFLQPKSESTKWSNELLVVYHKGEVKSILLSPLDNYESEENIKLSLESYYPQGITAVAYDYHNLLILTGPPSGNENGITVWRILNDFPYLKTAFDSEKGVGSSSFLRFLPGFSNQSNPKTVSNMKISPDGKLLACLHFSGEISLWRMPGISFLQKWSLREQPEYDKCNPEMNENVKTEQFFIPVDICWWSNSALVIARRNGALSVCSMSTLNNLLGDSPEFLAFSPQISSIEGDRPGVIALECETTCTYKKRLVNKEYENDEDKEKETSMLQATIQAALYSVTDIERFEPKRKAPKVTQRTYRMVALKRTTPEELYTRKIDLEEYEEALLLAKKYNLDCDLVYQKRWRNSQASKESIHNYLDKVNKILWVVNECVERVPEALEDAKELLEFGLKKIEFDQLSFEKLNAMQIQLITYRTKLLKYFDKLTIYEKIIGMSEKYSSSEYDSFRKKSSIVATVNFARQENWQAVSIMFTYAGSEVLPYWLPILSNFPETLRPLQYRSLLPEVIGKEVIPWEVQKLRDLDWCEKPPFQSWAQDENFEDDILYQNDSCLREFQAEPIVADIVEEWYKKRAYEIEKKTGLVDHALSLVTLAKERGIKGLNKLHNDILTLESYVYLVGDENITLPKIESLTHIEQCKILLSRTCNDSFIDDLKNLIVPFAKRCKEQYCHSTYSLLRDILLDFSENSLELHLRLLNHLKDGFMNPLSLSLTETASIVLDCIYSCPKNDQLECCFFILECLPQRVDSTISKEDTELHDRIDQLEIHLEVCEILERYKTPRSVRYIHENEDNVDVGKQLMENMSEFTISESLDFDELLADVQYIRSKVFPSIPASFCYELNALSQMSCECEEIIQSAEDVLQCRKGENDKVIPYERSVELVLRAARSHFEKADFIKSDFHHMQLSQTCLRVIGEPHPQISEELDLIEAVTILGDFDVNVLPLQVRKCENRMNLIESCLKAKPENYKSWEKLLILAQALRIYGVDRAKREGEVLMLIADYALNSSDYNYCSEICNRLVSKNFSPAWTIVRLLAQNKDYGNNMKKKLFFAFAILHCPIENAEELIESRVLLHQSHFI